MEFTSALILVLLILLWLVLVLELFAFLWKFHRNCFGLSVEQSTLELRVYLHKYSGVLNNFSRHFLLRITQYYTHSSVFISTTNDKCIRTKVKNCSTFSFLSFSISVISEELIFKGTKTSHIRFLLFYIYCIDWTH